MSEILTGRRHVNGESETACRFDVFQSVVDVERLFGDHAAGVDHLAEDCLGWLQFVHLVGEEGCIEIVLHVVSVGAEHLFDEFHRGGVVVREYIGADSPSAQRLYLPEQFDRYGIQKFAVGPFDLFVGDVGAVREAAHLVAGLVEGNVAVLEAPEHFGRVAGVDKLGHGIHAEAAEGSDATLQIERNQHAAQVENYVLDGLHGMDCFFFRPVSGGTKIRKIP